MESVFEELYSRYHREVFSYLLYLVKDRTAAEDLMQEVYIKALHAYHSFKGESSRKTWLFAIARNLSIDYFRKQNRLRDRVVHVFAEKNLDDNPDPRAPLPEEVVLAGDQAQELYQLLDKCTLDQKNVLILRYIQSMSIHETAAILNWTQSKVKTTQHRALKRLRTLFDNGGKEENE